ncbi:hypothetical protein SAMN05444344_0380 [Tenacibaculum mesophilum]|nr:hypothetical protein [Tenacibaculum mesophilum]SHF53583.1 hypothetical protein SAMN05444344_0380 [Tenacibaculum mesophilum]
MAIKKYKKDNYTAKELYTYVQVDLLHSYLLALPATIHHNNKNRTLKAREN